ncbi:taurine ABC transporter substrate-binding protein [Amylibacter kogurei]|uniref:Taurine ABC transporter substrate-binding protein n=1 Tax=Paramylibacter kogurei TaxID=1889778 RepID=A0A2G5K8V0_9RHOB|nr:ABC transporter substrate-binding protein [Amylibacter kogurei]PIB25966.1 taurine ABC transporter substrate-binding protein [Amylibacter kogurei]
MKLTKTLTAMAVALAATTGGAHALDELTVGYFLEWPTPNQYAQANKMYSEALGIPVNWVSFDAGTAMSAAMASGDVHISFSQGVTPFLVATAAGQDLQVVDVAVSYSDNDNCVVRSELEIDASNVAELKGKKVAVPLGTAAHSGFLAQMKHFGIAEADLTIVDMAPSDSAAAFSQPDTDLAMACGWGGSLRTMKEYGNVLMSGAEKEAVVGKVFDVTSIPTSFGEENPELLAKFLSVTAKMNAMYAADRAPMMEAISKEAGMDLEGTTAVLDVFAFPTIDEQLSDAWLGGFVGEYLTSSAKTLEEGGKIQALDDYNALINTSYLEAASKM